MYFEGRTHAGKILADEIARDYAGQPCAVVALGAGGVMVGIQVAARLKSVICMLLTDPIDLPNEPDPIGNISETGSFTYNKDYSDGEIDELLSDYRGYVEDEKRVTLSHLHQLAGEGTAVRPDLLVGKHIILVSDGIENGNSLDVVADFLKPMKILSTVIATPVASTSAVDRMHVLGDKIYCLNVADNFLDTEHYYEQHDVPSREDAVEIIEEVLSKWREPGTGGLQEVV